MQQRKILYHLPSKFSKFKQKKWTLQSVFSPSDRAAHQFMKLWHSDLFYFNFFPFSNRNMFYHVNYLKIFVVKLATEETHWDQIQRVLVLLKHCVWLPYLCWIKWTKLFLEVKQGNITNAWGPHLPSMDEYQLSTPITLSSKEKT